MSSTYLDFEQPIAEMEAKLAEVTVKAEREARARSRGVFASQLLGRL